MGYSIFLSTERYTTKFNDRYQKDNKIIYKYRIGIDRSLNAQKIYIDFLNTIANEIIGKTLPLDNNFNDNFNVYMNKYFENIDK